MKTTTFENPTLKEKYTKTVTDNGLEIYINENKKFSNIYAVYGTRYGSIDNDFEVDGKRITVPNGVAHFLEHKLFESEEQDAFERFAQTGASANAYTSFDRTCYLFNCTDHFYESFEILLDFVQHPYFTAQTVQKEQGIIGQEIQMYDDSVEWIIMFNLLSCLYHNHPVKINIAGTKETIAQITDKTLYDCYNAFYNPQNMFISVSGNVDTERILEMVDKLVLPGKSQSPTIRHFEDEPSEIVCPYKCDYMEVATPQVLMGYKCEIGTNENLDIERNVAQGIMCDMLAGPISRLNKKMLDTGIGGNDFTYDFLEGRGYTAILFGGRTLEPEKFVELVKEEITAIQTNGFDPEDFENVRRKMLGNYIVAFDDIEGVGDLMVNTACTGIDLFEEYRVVKTLTCEKLNEYVRADLNPERLAVSVIFPKKEKK